MKIDEAEFNSKAWTLGVGSALMIVSGYYGELVVTGDLTPRWMCWGMSMAFFLYIVNELLNGLAAATNSEADPVIAGKIRTAQVWTVVVGAHTQSCTCFPCWASMLPTQLSAFRSAIAPRTSSQSAELESSSTRSLMQSPTSRVSCD